MRMNTIARIVTAVILSLGAIMTAAGTASAEGPEDGSFLPPYCAGH